MQTRIRTNAPPQTAISIRSQDFADGYQKGQQFYLSGEAQHEPDENYVIDNLIALHEDGAFENLTVLRWHIGFLMGMVSAGNPQE